MEQNLNHMGLDSVSLGIVIVCALVSIFGIFKILKKGFSMVIWITIVIVSIFVIGYKLRPETSGTILAKIQSGEIVDLIPQERIETLCERLNCGQFK